MDIEWSSLLDHNALQFTLVQFVVLESVFLGLSVFYHAIHKYGLLQGYKVHPSLAWPPAELLRNCIQDKLVDALFARPLFTYFVIYPLFAWRGMGDLSAPLPDLLTVLGSLAVFVAVDDTWFYWGHRLLHHRHLYAAIHKKHHRFKIPLGLGTEYAHPIEALLVNAVSTMLGSFLLGSHPKLALLYAGLKLWQSMESHSGYVFPFPWSMFDAMENGRHEFHHSRNDGNFGGIFAFWDQVMGTDAPFEKFRMLRAKNGAVESMPPVHRSAATKGS